MGVEIVIAVLIGIVSAQQIFYMRQIQKLIDKIMSRSYTEYEKAKEPPPVRVKVSNDIPEDLRPLQEFQM